MKGCLTPFLRFLAAAPLLALPARAEIALDEAFWDAYRPYQQYSDTVIGDLGALSETDLLETGRSIDGIELRFVGRRSPLANLISVRVAIDSTAGKRLQVKIVPDIVQNETGKLELHRRQLDSEQAGMLVRLLEQWDFWDAPYRLADDECTDAGSWIIEGIRPGRYQLIERHECAGLDPAAAEVRDYLLAIAGLTK